MLEPLSIEWDQSSQIYYFLLSPLVCFSPLEHCSVFMLLSAPGILFFTTLRGITPFSFPLFQIFSSSLLNKFGFQGKNNNSKDLLFTLQKSLKQRNCQYLNYFLEKRMKRRAWKVKSKLTPTITLPPVQITTKGGKWYHIH